MSGVDLLTNLDGLLNRLSFAVLGALCDWSLLACCPLSELFCFNFDLDITQLQGRGMSERCFLTLNSIFAQDQLTSDWGFCSSCVSMVHEQVLSWWWNIQNLLTDFIDLLKRDQSFFFTLPSSGLGISITDTFWHKLRVGTGSAHKWPKILQFLCIDDSWTCLKLLSWWWNTYNLQQRNKLLYSKWTE